MTKICTKCGVEKPLSEFTKSFGRGYHGHSAKCRICKRAYEKEWHGQSPQSRKSGQNPQSRKPGQRAYRKKIFENNPEGYRLRNREKRLKRHGLTFDAFEKLSEQQSNKCAICDSETKLHIDHCHATGKIRGLLCFACNVSLGKMKDSPYILERALEYILSGGVTA
jgi:hypothetical protein